MRDVLGIFYRRRIHRDIVPAEYLTRCIVGAVFCRIRIAIKRIHQRVVCQFCEIGERRDISQGYLQLHNNNLREG